MKKHIKLFEEFEEEQEDFLKGFDPNEFLGDLGIDNFSESAIRDSINKYSWKDLSRKRIISSVKFKEIQIVPGSAIYNSLPWRTRDKFTKYETGRFRRGSSRNRLGITRKKNTAQKPTVFFGKTVVKWDLTAALNYHKDILKKEEEDMSSSKYSKGSRIYKILKGNIEHSNKTIDILNKLILLDKYIRVTWTFIIFNNDDYILAKDEPNEPYKGIGFSVSASVTHPINKSEILYKRAHSTEEYNKSYEEALLEIFSDFDTDDTFEYIAYNKKEEYAIIYNLIKAYKHRKTTG